MTPLLTIDPTSPTPIWKQIEDEVRRRIVSGQLEPGSAIPSVRDLCKMLRVNPATVSKAYQRLTDAGVLEVRRGAGTFVAELDERQLISERQRLLEDAATNFARVAESMGAGREESIDAVEAVWNQAKRADRGRIND
jgi:GntR family transcriptional regulator